MAEKKKRAPGGGRTKGSPNKPKLASIGYIMGKFNPIEFLIKVAKGDRMTAAAKLGDAKAVLWRPTPEQRISAAQTLAKKVLPDLRSSEVAIKGDPISVKINLG